MPVKYIGRTTTLKGKPLWEILGNLKNHGVGRMVIRHALQKYPEPCYMRILKVAALPDTSKHPHDPRKVRVLVERTFRGETDPKPKQIDSVSYKPDYMLIPKDEEHRYLNHVKRSVKILPRTIEMPPLLKEILIRQAKKDNTTPVLHMPVKYNLTGMKNYVVAKEGETPTVEVSMGLGTPASPHLYADIKYDDSS